MTQTQEHNVPALRFTEFSGEWKPTTLGRESVCLDNKRIPLKEGDRSKRRGAYPYYGASGIIDTIDDYLFDETLVLLAEDGANIIMRNSPIAFLAKGKFWVNNHAHVYRAKGSPLFLATYLENLRYDKYNTGTAQPKLNGETCKKLKLNFPTLPEQQKIAAFLSSVDRKIAQLGQKKSLLEQYKKGMMQKLFSQELRFKDAAGNNFPDWEEKRLGEILLEHKVTNKDNNTSEVFSVAKHKGVINQIEHLGRSYAAASISHYKVAHPFDVIYTKSPTSNFPFGIIKQNLTGRAGVVSPLYAVLRPINQYAGFMLHCYFESWVNTYNYLNPLVQKGAKNTMSIRNDDFLNGAKFLFPTSEREHQKIADFLSSIDRKIDLVADELDHAKTFKKGLLQQMFI